MSSEHPNPKQPLFKDKEEVFGGTRAALSACLVVSCLVSSKLFKSLFSIYVKNGIKMWVCAMTKKILIR